MADFPPQFRTTNATLQLYPFGGPVIPADSCGKHRVYVFASDHVGNAALWTIDILTLRVNSNAPTVIGTPVKQATAGASTWSITPLTNPGGQLQMQVQGAVGVTIDWWFTNVESFQMVGAFVP